jgi:hypothetical protein
MQEAFFSWPCTILRFWSFVVRINRTATLSMYARSQLKEGSHLTLDLDWTRNVEV